MKKFNAIRAVLIVALIFNLIFVFDGRDSYFDLLSILVVVACVPLLIFSILGDLNDRKR